MSAETPEPKLLPGYQVYKGRLLLHARSLGSAAAARQEGRPWHVVGRSIAELSRSVARDHTGQWRPT